MNGELDKSAILFRYSQVLSTRDKKTMQDKGKRLMPAHGPRSFSGFSIRAGGQQIRRLFHMNSPLTFLWKLPQFKYSIDVLSLNKKAKI